MPPPSGQEVTGEGGEIQYELIPDKHKPHNMDPLPAGVTMQVSTSHTHSIKTSRSNTHFLADVFSHTP